PSQIHSPVSATRSRPLNKNSSPPVRLRRLPADYQCALRESLRIRPGTLSPTRRSSPASLQLKANPATSTVFATTALTTRVWLQSPSLSGSPTQLRDIRGPAATRQPPTRQTRLVAKAEHLRCKTDPADAAIPPADSRLPAQQPDSR